MFLFSTWSCRFSRCYTWHLPSECHLEAPAAGKCCSTPSCPAGYHINYPPDYVANWYSYQERFSCVKCVLSCIQTCMRNDVRALNFCDEIKRWYLKISVQTCLCLHISGCKILFSPLMTQLCRLGCAISEFCSLYEHTFSHCISKIAFRIYHVGLKWRWFVA